MKHGTEIVGSGGALTKLLKDMKDDAAKRRAVPLLPVSQRPRCSYCGKRLKPYRWRKVGDVRMYGNYGDNQFCGLNCGYKYALAIVKALVAK